MASQWSFLTPEAAAVSVVAAIGAKLLYSYYNPGTATEQRYVPFAKDFPNNEEVLVVDCTHPTAVTLSHHRSVRNPAGLKPSDTSTGLVLNALRSSYGWNKEVAAALAKPYVSTNHFDIDSFLSVWCLLNRSLALQHEAGGRQAPAAAPEQAESVGMNSMHINNSNTNSSANGQRPSRSNSSRANF
jgi:hypothetical protein